MILVTEWIPSFPRINIYYSQEHISTASCSWWRAAWWPPSWSSTIITGINQSEQSLTNNWPITGKLTLTRCRTGWGCCSSSGFPGCWGCPGPGRSWPGRQSWCRARWRSWTWRRRHPSHSWPMFLTWMMTTDQPIERISTSPPSTTHSAGKSTSLTNCSTSRLKEVCNLFG